MLLWWKYIRKCRVNRALNIIFVWEVLLRIKLFYNISTFIADDDAYYENGILLTPQSSCLKYNRMSHNRSRTADLVRCIHGCFEYSSFWLLFWIQIQRSHTGFWWNFKLKILTRIQKIIINLFLYNKTMKDKLLQYLK